eukprot:8112081-Alexandrium_andersonii.AAC.1
MEAAVLARPMGQTALSATPNRRKLETSILQVQTQEATRFARRLLRSAVRQGGGGLRPLPIRSRGYGRLAH